MITCLRSLGPGELLSRTYRYSEEAIVAVHRHRYSRKLLTLTNCGYSHLDPNVSPLALCLHGPYVQQHIFLSVSVGQMAEKMFQCVPSLDFTVADERQSRIILVSVFFCFSTERNL